MAILTVLSALLGAVIGFAAAGFGAAAVLIAVFGDREGSNSMGGFFGFGPLGALAGALLGAGLMLAFNTLSRKRGKRLIVSGGVVLGLGGLLLLIASTPDRGPHFSQVIEFELEYPAVALQSVQIPGPDAMWGAGGGSSDDRPISRFFDRKCSQNVCVVTGSVAASGDLQDFRITTKIGQNKGRYLLNVPPLITGPADWSVWRSEDGVRWRWKIVNR